MCTTVVRCGIENFPVFFFFYLLKSIIEHRKTDRSRLSFTYALRKKKKSAQMFDRFIMKTVTTTNRMLNKLYIGTCTAEVIIIPCNAVRRRTAKGRGTILFFFFFFKVAVSPKGFPELRTQYLLWDHGSTMYILYTYKYIICTYYVIRPASDCTIIRCKVYDCDWNPL